MPPRQTRITSVMEEIQARIASRVWQPGARLPSVRTLARSRNLSVSTVVEAYERLVAENLIVARPGSGFYVVGPTAPLTLMQSDPTEREIDPLWISRQSLDAGQTALKPGCGWLPESWMYEEGLRRALRSTARGHTPLLTDYSPPAGHPELRQLLTRRLGISGIQIPPQQLMLTESGTQAIDLICRFLLEPGDTVLVDDPCYFNFHALLRAHRAKIVGIPWHSDGPDLQAFDAALRHHRPRLYITNSGIQNPTGATLSPAIAHRLLKLAEAANLVVVEDDIFADLEHSPAPRLAAFDGLERTIAIGSFSKTVSASLRCGFIAARRDWLESLIDLKIATSFSGGGLAAEVLLRVLTDGGYRRHMDALRARLSLAMERAIERLAPLGITPWLIPQAGMFLWCQLPPGIDAESLARECLTNGVILAPGNAFSQSRSAQRFVRFNVSRTDEPHLYHVLEHALHHLCRSNHGADCGER
ncbi:PLP-dependent aminotransferase family protein [Jejubacter calystegiae]|uniref:PLP-dependent aminotransferase family protein n=1 Tax=Jejubacter calystegiae TaxID=2579935 RepID=A0A4P8YKW2_9ENTR|nr:PLP-dependent aminotransferase family protein [Jejubacter calystegiae]QCT21379.1 PLP-dependent aminotransferase family protein [Jejubacter calystegiae]